MLSILEAPAIRQAALPITPEQYHARQMEVFSVPSTGNYQSVRVHSAHEMVAPIRFPAIRFDLAELFGHLPRAAE